MANVQVPLEYEEQQVVVDWLRLNGIRLHHSPNETGRSLEARRRAVRMKRLGTSPGFPDLIVVIPKHRSKNGQSHLLFIEMKRRQGSVVSGFQLNWIAALNGLDSPYIGAYTCRGAQEAIDLVNRYLKPEPSSSPF